MRLPTRTANKFGARSCELFGQHFASQAEAARYAYLRDREQKGEIRDLVREPVYELAPSFRDRAGTWYAPIRFRPDFRYREGNRIICEDVKGGKVTATEAFRIRWRLALQRYPEIEWRLVES